MLEKKTKSDYEALIREGIVLEQDGGGIKVMRLPGQRILKLFRRKRLLSSQIWITHAARFSRNAEKLKNRDISTIEILTTFTIPEIERSAVLYKMLEGETLRDWLRARDTSSKEHELEKLGAFVAELHGKGVLFRSLHLGNVLVMPNGALGLIDIADTGFRRFGTLSTSQRIRNFHHMDRHDEDRSHLGQNGGQAFLQGYLKNADLSEANKQRITRAFKDIFVPPHNQDV